MLGILDLADAAPGGVAHAERGRCSEFEQRRAVLHAMAREVFLGLPMKIGVTEDRRPTFPPVFLFSAART